MKGPKVIPKAFAWIVGNLIWLIIQPLEWIWRGCNYIVNRW